jgi:uncharacterized RDD family membrane protein YckC
VQGAAGLLVTIALRLNGASAADLSGEALQLLGGLSTFAVYLPYFTLFHWQWGRTPGKKVMRVTVVSSVTFERPELGQALARAFAFLLSYGLFLIGLVMAGLDSRKRSLHDRIAGTLCLKPGDERGNHPRSHETANGSV